MALNDVQQLNPTGVTAGVYAAANVTVDGAGRVTSIAASSAGPGIGISGGSISLMYQNLFFHDHHLLPESFCQS
jgi:hypothetical protein